MSEEVPESAPAPQPSAEHPATPPTAQPPAQPPIQPPATAPQKKGFAITALVLGIVAIVGSWIPFVSIGSIIIGVVGLAFGIIAIVLAVSNKAAGKVMAIVGASLSLLAIVFGIVSTAAGVAAVDDALGEITSTPGVTSEAPNDDTATSEPEETDEAPSAGSMDNPATIGDGTVWKFEQGGDAWDVTFDAIQIAPGYSGDVVVLTGTATPTAISEGDLSSGWSFPSVGWIADGATLEREIDILDTDDFDDYRHFTELEATVGTTMKFMDTAGLKDGVIPDLMSVQMLFGDETIYFATGLAK